MRRAVFLGLGLLEVAVAVLLVLVGAKLPSRGDVEEGMTRVQGLTAEASKQVILMRDSQDQVLGSVARGMEAWANALDPDMIRQLGQGTEQLADFLQKDIGPAAARSAKGLGKAIETFQKDALLMAKLLRETPPDLKAAKEIHESLGRFGEGMEKVSMMMAPERIKTMREGFKGMEELLDTGADQVDRLSKYTYPVIKFNGLKLETDEKPFWPDGDDIAKGMRKGARAMREAGKEFDSQVANMPHIQRSLDESRKGVIRMRDMLGKAVSNQEKLEPVLKNLPENSARLAEGLAPLAEDLNRILRELEKLTKTVAGLRRAQDLLASAEKTWPSARQGLLDSAERLRALQKAEQSETDDASREQKQSLDSLGQDLNKINASLPGMSQTVLDLLTLVRWLLWVIAAAVTLHACYVLFGVRQPKTAS